MPSDPPAAIACTNDVDCLATHLQEIVTSAMDKHTYEVPEINRRSQLPEEMLLAIRKQREIAGDGNKPGIQQLKEGLTPNLPS